MRKLLFISAFSLFYSLGHAQTEVKINPIGLLFSNVDLGVEFGLSQDFGIEPRILYNYNKVNFGDEDGSSQIFGLLLEGKYYFSPEKGIDKWYIGAYTKYLTGSVSYTNYNVDRTRFAIGFVSGYKWVSSKNIVFELALGIGRAFVNTYESDDDSIDLTDFPLLSIDVTGKLAVGYRF